MNTAMPVILGQVGRCVTCGSPACARAKCFRAALDRRAAPTVIDRPTRDCLFSAMVQRGVSRPQAWRWVHERFTVHA